MRRVWWRILARWHERRAERLFRATADFMLDGQVRQARGTREAARMSASKAENYFARIKGGA